jgi:uncharacterized membrane protein (DUF441 family)
MSNAPIEAKVTAATGTALVVGFIVSWLGASVFHGTVPDAVAGIVEAAVTAAATFGAGWLAKHTARPTSSTASVPPPAA